MGQAEGLIELLKGELRRRGITYAHVARELGLSESTIKRVFSSSNFSIKRLEQVCELAGLELDDLVLLAEDRKRDVEQLSEDQEEMLVSDRKLLLVAFLLFNHWAVEQILKVYEIDELEMVQLLARLDRLKIIDLLPENKVRVRLSRTFSWRRNGPIQKLFESQIQDEFFHSAFDGPGELRLVLNGMISGQSISAMHQKLHRLVAEFEQCVSDDRRSISTQRQGTTLVLAIRPWAAQMFENFRRSADAPPARTSPKRRTRIRSH